MTITKKLLALSLAALLLIGTLAGCGGDSGGGGGDAQGALFTIALRGDIVKLDPAFNYDNDTCSVVSQITEGLLRFDDNNQLQPMLAESWEIVDPTTYQYTIRDDVNFSDGTPMTAEDVVYSMERVKDPATGSYLNWMYDSVESIEKTGDWEVTVKLSQPDATWQYVPATPAGNVISKAYCEEHKDDFGSAEGGIIGTGPFVYSSWKSGSEVVLERNENYWDMDSMKTDITKIVCKVIGDDMTLTTALTNGQIDFTISTPEAMIEELAESGAVNLLPTDSFGIHYLAFNTSKAPFDDVNVRKAISSAIDLQSIQDNVVKDTGTIGTPMPMSKALYTLNPEQWTAFAESLGAYEYSLSKAKEYLAGSSVPDGFQCSIITKENAAQYSKALIIQEALKQINIDAEVVKVTSDEFYTYQFGTTLKDGKRDYDILVSTWGSDYPDPSGNLNPLYMSANAGEGGSNCAAYSNPKIDEYLSLASKETDVAKRTELMFDALKIIADETPYYFLNYPVYYATLSSKYTGFVMKATFCWDLNLKNVVLT